MSAMSDSRLADIVKAHGFNYSGEEPKSIGEEMGERAMLLAQRIRDICEREAAGGAPSDTGRK